MMLDARDRTGETSLSMCAVCDGRGTVAVEPSVIGWVYLWDNMWRMPSGATHDFGEGPLKNCIVVCLCPECYPSHWPDINTIN